MNTTTRRIGLLVLSNTGARAVALLSLAVTTVLVAHQGGPAAVGLYTLLRVLPGLAGVLFSCGLPGAVAYFLSGPRQGDRSIRPTIVLVMLAGGAAGLAVWVLASPVMQGPFFPQLSLGLVVLAGIAVPSQLLVAVGKSSCQANDMAGANAVIVLEELVFLPAFAVLRIGGMHGNALIVVALIVADLLAAAPAWARLAQRGFFAPERFGRPSLPLGREVTSYGIRGQLGGLLSLLNLRLDHVLLGAIAGPAVLGVYAVASKFAELLRLVPQALSYVLYPRFARSSEDQATSEARSALRTAGVLTAVAAVPLALGAGLLPVVYGQSFAAAVTPARILLLGLAGEGVAAVVTAYLYGRGRPGLNSLAMGGGLAVTVVLDLLLIPRFGSVGAAWASSVAYVATDLVLVASFLSLTRRSTRPLDPAFAMRGPA